MSMTSEEYWAKEAIKFESLFYRANYMRTQQEADNVALRKLVAMLYRCASGCLNALGPSCLCDDEDGCGMDCTFNGDGCCMTLLETRMRELGIEVGENDGTGR